MDLQRYLQQEMELEETIGKEKFEQLKKTIINSIVESGIDNRRLLQIDVFDYIVKTIQIKNINL